MVCYQGSCINESSITYKNNNCEPNSCKNGGICNNGFSTFAPFICTCQDGFTGRVHLSYVKRLYLKF